jgi:hypothetical protein
MHSTGIARLRFPNVGLTTLRGVTLVLTTARAPLLLAILAILGLVAVPPGSRPAIAQEEIADPVSVLRGFADAYNTGDEVVAAGLFTDDAVWVRAAATGGCARQTPCVGLEEIRGRLQDGVATNNCYTILDTTLSGNVVTGHAVSRNVDLRGRGIERVRNVWLVLVHKVMIVYLFLVN